MSDDHTLFGAVATYSGGRRCVRGREGSRWVIRSRWTPKNGQ
jgi:hypothetical protein